MRSSSYDPNYFTRKQKSVSLSSNPYHNALQAAAAGQQPPKFKPGDHVRLRYNKNLAGIVQNVQLDPFGSHKYYVNIHGTLHLLPGMDLEIAAPVVAAKPKFFDLAPLSKLILDDTLKKEIIAVLQQHKHKTKIFTEWGLDETIKYGKGMTFLFHGAPGTGKTWAANCIAECFAERELADNG